MSFFVKRESVSFRDKAGNPLEEAVFSKEVHGEYVPFIRDPEELKMKSVKQLESEYRKKLFSPKHKQPAAHKRPSVLRDLMTGLSGKTPQERAAAHKKHVEQLKAANLPLKRQLEIQRLQQEHMQLVQKAQRPPAGFVMTPWGIMPAPPQKPKAAIKKKKNKKKGK